MNQELAKILRQFIASRWGLIAIPSEGYLSGKQPRQELASAIEQAREQCGSCGCELDPLYDRALALLAHEPEGYRYEKLVRDKIPEIICRQGYTPHTRVLASNEYITELYRKLREETEEYLADENPEEIADILEVIEAICSAKEFSPDEILRVKAQKRNARGGFERRIYLISKD